MMNVCVYWFTFVDYDYDFYGYSDYRGGYTEPVYEDYNRPYEDEFYYDYPSNGVPPVVTGRPQRTTRNNAVG